jgi:hypothetical protein
MENPEQGSLESSLRRDIDRVTCSQDIMCKAINRRLKGIKEAQEGFDHSYLVLEKRISKLEIASGKSDAHRIISEGKESADDKFMRKYREYFKLDKYSYAPSLRLFITDPPSPVDDIRRYLFWKEYLSQNDGGERYFKYYVEEDDDE